MGALRSVVIVHCGSLSSGRERVSRARVIMALSLATCQYNFIAVCMEGRERERGNQAKLDIPVWK